MRLVKLQMAVYDSDSPKTPLERRIYEVVEKSFWSFRYTAIGKEFKECWTQESDDSFVEFGILQYWDKFHPIMITDRHNYKHNRVYMDIKGVIRVYLYDSRKNETFQELAKRMSDAWEYITKEEIKL